MKRTKAKINAMKRPADLVAAQEKMRSKHEGRTTTTAPQPFLPPTDSAVEQHFTPAQVAQQWGVSTRTVRRLFANTLHKVVRASCLTRGQDHQVWRKIMPDILEQISGLCDSGYTSDPRTNRQLYSIKKIAGRNPVLNVIACDSDSWSLNATVLTKRVPAKVH